MKFMSQNHLSVSLSVCNYFQVRNGLLEDAKKEGIEDTTQSIFAFLITRVRDNLHIVLGMSPVGEQFR